MSASSRMAQEVDEATSESSWTALAKGKERYWWCTDLEGELEKLEVCQKATPWNPKGRWATRQIAQRLQERKGEKLKEDEMKMDVDAPQGESAETKSSKRKVIRVKSEETQNYARETLAIRPGRSRGISFCAECPQRATRINLFLRQSLQ